MGNEHCLCAQNKKQVQNAIKLSPESFYNVGQKKNIRFDVDDSISNSW